MVHVASICIHTDRPKGPQALLHPGGEAPEPYREIFEFFIDNFKTYKPLLSAIKNEYEVTLAHQKRTIRALQPLKATVTTISEECTRQMLALQEKEKDEINKLKQENRRLLKFIDNMKEEKNSLQTQVEHLRTSVAEEYARYLNEHSAHKLLLAKLNEIHNERLDMARHQLQDIKGEDVVKLTLALKMARQDLTTSQVKLNKMTADYGDVVPRRDFESLENKYSDLLREMKTLQKDLNQLRKDHEALLGIQAETTEEQDNLRAELQRVQRNRTPRPNWAKCSEVIPGGAERWGGLAKGKSSDQLVDVLLEEIGTRMLRERDIFPGWGKGDRVPVYLRHEGEVKNKKLTKKDAVNILKDVWKEKMAQEQQVGEEQYHAQNRLVSSLQRELAACDISDSGSLTGEQFSTAVREAFPLKRKESIQELVDASRYKLDSTEDLIDYKSLFKEDEEGNAEPLVAKLRSQYVREKQEYLGQLKDKLGDLTEVSADDLKTAFCTINPTIDDQMLDTYVGLAYQVRRGQPEQEVVPVEMALERLLTGDVRRAGPSPQEGSTASFEGEQGDIQYTRPSPGRGIRVLETKTRQESSSAMAVPKLQSKWCKPKKQNLFFLL
ncbi:translin-associated factor X-interacting protein 1 isoform X5 [Egretta garzetta]|uniref:translin-associated factor X-interacting protein 1 isoform X5 n=1 Tax=Egretta garzetta TaxID=188379 RepID=UPI00163BAC9C|nr:translin-associated factor X-interacting protein 1 isoform X5 [Egretta garzetta]